MFREYGYVVQFWISLCLSSTHTRATRNSKLGFVQQPCANEPDWTFLTNICWNVALTVPVHPGATGVVADLVLSCRLCRQLSGLLAWAFLGSSVNSHRSMGHCGCPFVGFAVQDGITAAFILGSHHFIPHCSGSRLLSIILRAQEYWYRSYAPHWRM